jgi:hypothetical protein
MPKYAVYLCESCRDGSGDDCCDSCSMEWADELSTVGSVLALLQVLRPAGPARGSARSGIKRPGARRFTANAAALSSRQGRIHNSRGEPLGASCVRPSLRSSW